MNHLFQFLCVKDESELATGFVDNVVDIKLFYKFTSHFLRIETMSFRSSLIYRKNGTQ